MWLAIPRPRRKGVDDSFRFHGREFATRRLNAKWSEVRLPRIGWVKYRDTRPLSGRTLNATISYAADGWYISFTLELADMPAPAHVRPAVGIDRGVANTLALSTGQMLTLPASLKVLEQRKRRAQKTLARRTRGSRRYAKARARVARLAARQARIRRDWHHRVSRDLAGQFGTGVLEDLNTAGMTASARGTAAAPGTNVRAKAGLNRAILNQGWHLFETLLDYKLEERGGHLVKVPAHRTSQTCAACGTVDPESRESQASFRCRRCGRRANADYNAAINILRRNTSSMVVEDGHWPSVEAITGRGRQTPENPHPSGWGRC